MKENWIPVYHDRMKECEGWACTDGSDLRCDATHEEGPPNEIFRESGSKMSTLVEINFEGRTPPSQDPNYEYIGKGKWRYAPQSVASGQIEAI